MKALLLSLSPFLCEKIIQGEKHLDLRQKKPNLTVPFKCYLYELQGNKYNWNVKAETIANNDEDRYLDCKRGAPEIKRTKNGTPYFSYGRMSVIGEFVCDRIEDYQYDSRFTKLSRPELCQHVKEQVSAAERKQVEDLVWDNGLKYGLHISDFVVYDVPKPLEDFRMICAEWEKGKFAYRCHHCRHYVRNDADMCSQCNVEGEMPVSTVPKSFLYVVPLT